MISEIGLYLKLGIGAFLGAILGAGIAGWIAYHKGDTAGYSRYAAEQSQINLVAEKARKKNDVRIQNLDDFDFCVDSLQRRGLPVDACDELRGIRPQ